MLKVKLLDTKEVLSVYEVCYNSDTTDSNRPLFLVYKKELKKFMWIYVDCFKPYCKELFKIVKISDRRTKANVYAVHRNITSLMPVCYLIYKNKSWETVYADEYEILSDRELY